MMAAQGPNGEGARRFGAGAAVLCKTGDAAWLSGRVVSVDYREDGWPPGRVKPYVVELDDKSDTVLVHADTDEAIRKAGAGRRSDPRTLPTIWDTAHSMWHCLAS